VFANEDFRRKLTRKMGILIMRRVLYKILTNIIKGKNVMIVDAPLLYETKVLEHVCFPVIVVGCSEETQIKRLMKRDGYT
jgi:dephospho-CoA kinase